MRNTSANQTKSGLSGFLLASAIIAICASCSGEDPQEKTFLRVITYPWIPDAGDDQFANLDAFIEADFESLFPHIDLQLRPISESFGVYELEAEDGSAGTVVQWLTNEPVTSDTHDGDQGYHLVEIDTLLLDELVTRDVILPWQDIDISDWHQAGTEAVTLEEQIFGVPRLLCGHFLLARNETLTSATTADELITALNSLPTDKRAISGNWLGSWNSTALYLDAWQDTFPESEIQQAFGSVPGTVDLDDAVLAKMQQLSGICEFDGANYCIDGTYDDWEDPHRAAREFGHGDVYSMFGYSERLHYIAKAAREQGKGIEDIHVSSIPLGNGTMPILFADAFVMSKNCDTTCQEAAHTFVSYFNSPRVQEYVLMSKDAGEDGVPRYLLPATHSAFTETELANNQFYIELNQQINKARSYPNQGFYSVKDEAKCQVYSSLNLESCE